MHNEMQFPVQSTLALRTPRYYGRSLLRTKFRSPSIEVWLKMTPRITDSRYSGHSRYSVSIFPKYIGFHCDYDWKQQKSQLSVGFCTPSSLKPGENVFQGTFRIDPMPRIRRGLWKFIQVGHSPTPFLQFLPWTLASVRQHLVDHTPVHRRILKPTWKSQKIFGVTPIKCSLGTRTIFSQIK